MSTKTKTPVSAKSVRKPVRNVKVPLKTKAVAPVAARSVPLAVDPKPAVKKAMPVKDAKSVSKPTAPAKPAVAGKPVVATKAASAAGGTGSYVLEDQIGFRLRRAHQRATNIFADIMAEFDVTPTQFAALAKLDDLGAISQNQLGRLTAMDPATILGVVGRLHRSGWLRARPSIEDQRLMLIELTPEGQFRTKAMKVKAAMVSNRTVSPLSSTEAQTLNELLARLS